MVEYFTLEHVPGRTFFNCERMRAKLSTDSCAAMWRKADAATDGTNNSCKLCPLGAVHAGEVAASMSPLKGALICARCHRQASRLIGKHLCVSCKNREYELLKGRNAKGTAPVKTSRLDLLQFHGDESPRECKLMADRINKRWIKALRISHDDTTETIVAQIQALKDFGACSVLLDAYHPDKFGGTGDSFDWEKIPKNSPLPIILAGGLTADNVGEAIAKTNVYGVDVSGGIESAKGGKSLQKMTGFLAKVRN